MLSTTPLMLRQSLDWTYLQTPQFMISTKQESIAGIGLELSVRYGAIADGSVAREDASISTMELPKSLIGLKLHEVQSWEDEFCSQLQHVGPVERSKLAEWLHRMLPSAR